MRHTCGRDACEACAECRSARTNAAVGAGIYVALLLTWLALTLPSAGSD